MNASLLAAMMLADRTSTMFRHMGSGFRRKQHASAAEIAFWLVIVVLAAVAAVFVSRMVARRGRRSPRNHARAMFLDLCRAHQLDRASRRLLIRLAEARRLASAAQIFLEPDCFDVQRLPARLGARRGQIAALGRKVFGAALEAPAENLAT